MADGGHDRDDTALLQCLDLMDGCTVAECQSIFLRRYGGGSGSQGSALDAPSVVRVDTLAADSETPNAALAVVEVTIDDESPITASLDIPCPATASDAQGDTARSVDEDHFHELSEGLQRDSGFWSMTSNKSALPNTSSPLGEVRIGATAEPRGEMRGFPAARAGGLCPPQTVLHRRSKSEVNQPTNSQPSHSSSERERSFSDKMDPAWKPATPAPLDSQTLDRISTQSFRRRGAMRKSATQVPSSPE
eukprot:m.30560 g.30560  ORF g.30560 m.30560 type:complete len:248 (-) comp6815_c0_seq2:202-945(-)